MKMSSGREDVVDLSSYDLEQVCRSGLRLLAHTTHKIKVKLMEEMCILVDEQDNVVGYDTKKNCTLSPCLMCWLIRKAISCLASMRDCCTAHSGVALSYNLYQFASVFLFNSSGELLLQQRADEKV